MAEPAGAPDPRRRFKRRMLAAAVAVVAGWTALVVVFGTASGLWQGRGPHGGRFVVGLLTIGVAVGATVTYRRVSGPVSDLLYAAEAVTNGDYSVAVEVRGFRELRLLTETFNEMAGRLEVTEEQRRRFLADITHELRNPLAILRSEIEAQLDGVHPRDDDHLGSLLEEIQRLGRLVDDLHTLALAESGQLVLRLELVPFGALVYEAIDRFDARARQQGVALRAGVPPLPAMANVDPARLGQVLDNLLANAIRHTPPGGEVRVEVTISNRVGEHDSLLTCRVVDAGPGFREDDLGQVFDRFTRAGDSHGSGLGLSIARDLIRAHGGTIRAANDPVTGGASVTFTLPLPSAEARPERQHARAARSTLHSQTALPPGN